MREFKVAVADNIMRSADVLIQAAHHVKILENLNESRSIVMDLGQLWI